MTPLACDAVAIKTAARANPTLLLVKNGTILGKWAYTDLGARRESFHRNFLHNPEQPADTQTYEPIPDSLKQSSSPASSVSE